MSDTSLACASVERVYPLKEVYFCLSPKDTERLLYACKAHVPVPELNWCGIEANQKTPVVACTDGTDTDVMGILNYACLNDFDLKQLLVYCKRGMSNG